MVVSPFSSIARTAASLLLLLAPAAAAQWVADPRGGMPVDTSGGLSLCAFPDAAAALRNPMPADDGGMVCIWERRSRYSSDSGSIRVQRLFRDGRRRWRPEGVMAGDSIVVTMTMSHVVAVVDDGRGGTLAALSGCDTSRSEETIKILRFDADGRTCWGRTGIRIVDSGGGMLWDLLPDGGGGAFVLFTATAGRLMGLFLQHVDSGGVPSWGGAGLLLAQVVVSRPRMMADGEGGVVCSWTDSLERIRVQRLSTAGARWPANGVIPDLHPGTHLPGCLTTDGAGGAIVTWRDDRHPAIPLMAQHLDAAGRPSWNPDGIQVSARTTAAPTLWWGSTVSDGSGGAFVFWYDGDSSSVRAQRIDSQGALLWAPDGILVSDRAVSPACHGTQWAGDHAFTIPQAVTDGAGGAIVIYETCETGRASGVDIYAQRIGRDGARLWQPGGVPVATADSTQQNTHVTSDGAGGAFILWEDERAGWTDCDLYAAHLCPDGTLGICDTTTSVTAPPARGAVAGLTIHPNPFNASATIRYETMERGATQVAVLDLLGRVCAVPVDCVHEPGSYSVAFDASQLAAGLYCCVLRTPSRVCARMMSIVK
jgi:hypothetical protein